MFKHFSKMSVLEKILFIIFKPFILYILSPIIFIDFLTYAIELKIIILLSFSLVVLAICALELMVCSRIQYYKALKEIDDEKVIEISGRYLSRDYSSVKVFKKSLRGKLYRRGLEEIFHLAVKDGRFIVTIKGNFPFPISMINRGQISRDIENELRSHGVFRA